MRSRWGWGATASDYSYDANGNMVTRELQQTVDTQGFDAQNRLESVTVNGETTTFRYDAEGNRVLTLERDGTAIYTPTPDYEEEVRPGGAVIKRVTYRVGGQLVGELLRYEPFGDARGTQPSSDITDRGFTGHRENRDIGLTLATAGCRMHAMMWGKSAVLPLPIH